MKRLIAIAAGLALAASLAWAGPVKVCGKVTADGKPVAGVCISDGAQVVKTNAKGVYSMKTELPQGLVFMTVPSGYEPLAADGIYPSFWATAGNGEKKEVHNFQLKAVDQSKYRILFLTDGHFTNSAKKQDFKFFQQEILPLYTSGVEKAKAAGEPVYSINLGDFSHELYWVENNCNLEDVCNFFKDCHFPAMLYSIPGNHDNDAGFLDSLDMDRKSEHLYRKVLGPTFYSQNIGGDHWIFMDNVIFKNDPLIPINPKHPAVPGQRNYAHSFTRAELDWIKEDLKNVPDGTSIYFVTHCPFFWPENKLEIPKDQMEELDADLARFGHVELYAGHEHRMYNNGYDNRWPKWHERVIPAISGDMWETCPKYQILGVDGNDAGVETGYYSNGKASYSYDTHRFGEKMFRCYDLNSVGAYYASDKGIANEKQYYPNRTDYSDPKYANGILVNCWWWSEGDKVEILENGKPLTVTKVTLEDPLFNISRIVPAAAKNKKYQDSYKESKNYHMFLATATTADSPVVVRYTTKDGKVFEEKILRPKDFDKNAR